MLSLPKKLSNIVRKVGKFTNACIDSVMIRRTLQLGDEFLLPRTDFTYHNNTNADSRSMLYYSRFKRDNVTTVNNNTQ